MILFIKRFFVPFFPVVMAQACFAQADLADVKTRIADYNKKLLPEKIFLHTDKNFYTVGDLIWFKAYVTDGIFNKPFTASKVAYVEVLDKSNTPVIRTKIALNEKGGDGSVQLPLSLNSGNYRIRAYTNWMKNEGIRQFFEKTLTIVNPLKNVTTQEDKTSPSYTLQLFPEGGNLVNGLSSKIAFHVTDNFGKGVSGKGYLLNQNNDTLSSFAPFKFGMGHFNLAPQINTTYKVVFNMDDGKTVSQILPRSFDSGYIMQLEEAADDKITITVKTNIASDREIFLLAQTRQIVKTVQKSLITNGTAVFIINKKDLDEGVSQLTVFNSEKKPVSERLFFIPPTSTQHISVENLKQKYATREKVEFDIPLTEEENMSLSVFQIDELEKGEGISIDQYLWLTSELNGSVEDPSYYFSPPNDEVKQATDYLMLTNGWRRFKWEALDQPPVLKFQREQFGHIVTGKITDLRTNTIAGDVQAFLSVPNSAQKLFTSASDSNGFVHFDVKDFFGQGEIVAQTNSQRDSLYKIEILSPFSESYSPATVQPFVLYPSSQASIINRSIGMQAQYIYTMDSIHRFNQPYYEDSLPFYGAALYKYRLDDYTRFNTMEEVLREYVREVNVGVKGSGTTLRFKIVNELEREIYPDELLVMVDGIPLFNFNKIFSVDPLKIKRLDIINRNYVLGNFIFHGLANFSSYNGLYDGLQLDENAITIDYEGLQLQREFYAPDYSTDATRSSRLPDLRTTLFWKPNITEKQIQFYTGDNKGRYLIVIQGIDSNGKTITATSQIEVK